MFKSKRRMAAFVCMRRLCDYEEEYLAICPLSMQKEGMCVCVQRVLFVCAGVKGRG